MKNTTINIGLLLLTALYICSIPLYLNNLYYESIVGDGHHQKIGVQFFLLCLWYLFVVGGLILHCKTKVFHVLALLMLLWMLHGISWPILGDMLHTGIPYYKHFLFVFIFLIIDQSRVAAKGNY